MDCRSVLTSAVVDLVSPYGRQFRLPLVFRAELRGGSQMLRFRRKTDYRQASETLAQVDYSTRGISERLGRRQILTVGALDLPPWLARTRDLSPLDTLIRLFLLAQMFQPRGPTSFGALAARHVDRRRTGRSGQQAGTSVVACQVVASRRTCHCCGSTTETAAAGKRRLRDVSRRNHDGSCPRDHSQFKSPHDGPGSWLRGARAPSCCAQR